MLEIMIDNCYRCDRETINDPNNSQCFWLNWRDLQIETKCNWQVIFHKYKDSSNQKYRKELIPNITVQPNKTFVRNVTSCKVTNLEKLGLCLYEDIYDKQELISTLEEIFKEEKKFTQHDVQNKELKEENKQLKEENEQLRKENEQLRKNNKKKQ